MDQVVELAREISELRQRLAQLEQEKAAIGEQIAERMNRIAMVAIVAIAPAHALPAATIAAPAADDWQYPVPLSTAILEIIRRSPRKAFMAVEIARELKMMNRKKYSNIRTHLSRMAKDGRVEKVAFGKYKARQS